MSEAPVRTLAFPDFELELHVSRSNPYGLPLDIVDTRDRHREELAREEHREAALAEALTMLSPVEARVFRARHLREVPMRVEALAEELAISEARVRDIAKTAMTRVRETVLANA